MKVRDRSLWLAQLAEIAQSEQADIGNFFIAYVEDWCDRAERLLKGEDPHTPLTALRSTLPAVLADKGFPSPTMMAQLLLVITANWDPDGSDLFEALNEVESAMVVYMVGKINDAAAKRAEEAAEVPADDELPPWMARVPSE